jgi:hypothetical protein
MFTVRKIVASAAIAALITTGSSAAIASTSAAPQAATQQAANPWVTLTMLTPVSASALGGAATTAAQPQPGGPYSAAPQGIGHIPIAVLVGWLAMVALIIYLGTRHNHHPNSPF